MRIEGIQKTVKNERVRISARYIWEDSNKPQTDVYFETIPEFANDIVPNANAFLLGGAMPAMLHGERRIIVDGQACPELRNGLITSMQQLREWHGKEVCHPISIEATQGFIPGYSETKGHVASFQSGGIDSLATLRSNRLDIPLEHPASIRDCLMIYGFDMGMYESMEHNLEGFEYARKRLGKLGHEASFTLIPIYTNLLHLDDDDGNQFYFHFASTLAAVAHAFVPRISAARIPSSDSVIGGLRVGGSHPLLDSNYSSTELRIIHDGTRFTRLEKVGLIAEWDAGLQNIRVCWDSFRPAEMLNCGTCEKCLRTMTQLLIFDKLKNCRAFPFSDVTPEQIYKLKVEDVDFSAPRREILKVVIRRLSYGNIKNWELMVPALKKIGRHDLVKAIQDKLAQYEAYVDHDEKESFRQRLSRIDKRLFAGKLHKIFHDYLGQ